MSKTICYTCTKAPQGGKFCPVKPENVLPDLMLCGSYIAKRRNLCNTCSKADVSCPIYNEAKYVTDCVEYREQAGLIDFLKPDKTAPGNKGAACVCGGEICDDTCKRELASVRASNVGSSDYAKHKTQPWDIWIEYNLNPWDADIVKRVLRTKGGKAERIEDYEKMIHVCQERIRQLKEQ